ncbi:MAG: isochorismatase family protein [Acidiferrobacteraceae bacterium]
MIGARRGSGEVTPVLLSADDCLLLLVDLQTRLLAVMPKAGQSGLRRRLKALTVAAAALNVPVLATRQYARGLGELDPELAAVLPAGTPIFDKTRFSCLGAQGLRDALDTRRPSLVIAGVEAHVCVLQTAFDLSASGFSVSVVADAVASRFEHDCEYSLQRMSQAGIGLVTTESVVFEWLRDAAHPKFKDLLPLIR